MATVIPVKHRFYVRLAIRMAPRFRWRIWSNFWRYSRAVRQARTRGPDRLPYTPPNVAVWVTNRCNKRCHFCTYSGGLNAANHRELELSLDRFKKLLALPIASNCLRLALYGGEPLLNEALPDMVRHAKSRGHLVTINTNGLLIKKRLAELLDCRPDLISLSYYPEDRETTEEAIALVARHIPVMVNYLYTEARLGDLESAVRCAAAAGAWAVKLETYDVQGTAGDCDLHAAGDAFGGAAAPSTGERRETPIAPDDVRILRLRRELQARYGRQLWISWPQPPSAQARNGRATCRTFWHSTWLDARGQMLPCCVWPVAAFAGDVWQGTAAWNSPRMMQLRQNMRRNVYPRICATCSHLYDDPLAI